jgi:hypothetical protein
MSVETTTIRLTRSAARSNAGDEVNESTPAQFALIDTTLAPSTAPVGLAAQPVFVPLRCHHSPIPGRLQQCDIGGEATADRPMTNAGYRTFVRARRSGILARLVLSLCERSAGQRATYWRPNSVTRWLPAVLYTSRRGETNRNHSQLWAAGRRVRIVG